MDTASEFRDGTESGALQQVDELVGACGELPAVAASIARLGAVLKERGPNGVVTAAVLEATQRFIATFWRVLTPIANFSELVDEQRVPPIFLGEAVLAEQYGFVPRVFQLQRDWPAAVNAEADLFSALIFCEERLSRADKERMMLASAVTNRDAYSCALHHQMLVLLGEGDSAKRITAGDVSALDPLERLACATTQGCERGDVQLAREGVSNLRPTERLEAVGVCALAQFVNVLQSRLQPDPDFPVPQIFLEKHLYPSRSEIRPTAEAIVREDPDVEVVADVKAGNTEAFAELVRRHTRRVFATLFGLLQDAEEARDVSQEVFLKAFESIARFEGRSKFSSWLMSIAINSGTEVLRRRKNFVPIESEGEEDDWRPTQLQEWSENPEQCFAREQVIELVRGGVMRLPNKYRVALLLRDVSEMPTEDAAEALGLSVPALKARVLRGRLMLREALAPHFMRDQRGAHG